MPHNKSKNINKVFYKTLLELIVQMEEKASRFPDNDILPPLQNILSSQSSSNPSLPIIPPNFSQESNSQPVENTNFYGHVSLMLNKIIDDLEKEIINLLTEN